jgi:acetoin utilization protein AcuC
MAVPIVYREELREYDFGPGHPFRGDRYDIFPQFLKKKLVEGRDYRIVISEPAGDDELSLICQRDYIDFCQRYYRAANLGLDYSGDSSRFISPDNIPRCRPGKVEEAARLIIGQAKAAADLVATSESPKVVALGGGMHHAKANYGEGFCIYNDVAFCARYLRQVCKLDRVLVLDTDAHAGNGTAEYFYEDPSVLLIDLHQDPRTLYPGTGFAHQIGSGNGRGFTINVPMPLFSGQDAYRRVFEEIVRPVAEEFRPQVIIRNGGSDPHAADELTNLGLHVESFRWLGEQVREMAEVCNGREIDLIGSGYNRQVLPHAWLALICGLNGLDAKLEEPEPATTWRGDRSFGDINVVIRMVKDHLSEYWHCLR